jgi:sulfate transport system permease protein
MAMGVRRKKSILPGFGLSLGYTLLYLSVLVLLPLAALVLRATKMTWGEFWQVISSEDVLAACRLSFGASAIAAGVNVVFGLLLAWVLVRYRFWGRKVVDALVDLPFALPTAVAGIALTTLYAPNGWLGQIIEGRLGIKVAFAPLGVVVALIFVSLPFVVRTVQPVLEDLPKEIEEAAGSLGATRWQTFWRVLFPELLPALVTGFTLAFARSIGEFGSVVFISGNLPGKTEIVPLLIIKRLEEYEFAAATALAVLMLGISFVLLLVINLLQRWMEGRRA